MGMSIDDVKCCLENGDFCSASCKYFSIGDNCKNNVRKIAIEIIQKYQKIQEVMDSRPDDDAKSNSKALGKIEVIMYENDD